MGSVKPIRTSLLLLILVVSTVATVLSQVAPAEANSQPTHVIDHLPYTITESGTYVLNSDLYGTDGITVDAINVTILGNGHRIVATASGATGVTIERYKYNVRVENLMIEDFDYGVYINYSGSDNWSGIVLSNLVIKNATTGIYNYDCWYNLLIEDTVIEASDRTEYGIYNEYADGAIMRNITLVASGETAPDSAAIYNYESEGTYEYMCRIEGNWNHGIYNEYVYKDCISNTVIVGPEIGIYSYDAEYSSIVNTVIANCSNSGIYISYGYYMGIAGSRISGCGIGICAPDADGTIIEGCLIENSTYSGIYLGRYSEDVNITSNQVYGNGRYGIEVHSRWTYVNIWGNVIVDNAWSPQAYDENGIGSWTGNYWSDWSGSESYVFTSNSDDSPLPAPLPDLSCRAIYAPKSVAGERVVEVNVEVENKGYANVIEQPLRLYWSEPAKFTQAPFIWFDLDESSATGVDGGDVLGDYGNYIIQGDDMYFIYKLPFAFEIYGLKYNYISISTNGLIEFLNDTESNLENLDSVHTYGYHRVMYYRYSPAGTTTLFAYSGDLEAINFAGVFNLGDKVVVWFDGSTDADGNLSYPVQYQIILYSNGTVLVSLGNLTFTELGGDGFTGLYVSNLGAEVAAGYMLPPMTSWRITPKLNLADEVSIDLSPGEVRNFTMVWDTSSLPHYSEFTLWGDPDASGDTSLYNDLAYSSLYVVPPPAPSTQSAVPVGGEVEVPRSGGSEVVSYYLLAAVVLSAVVVAASLRRE